METHEATFDIDSRSDADAARRVLERLYDTVREESRTVRAGSDDATALLEEFEALRDAARSPAPGTLTVTYERSEDSFD